MGRIYVGWRLWDQVEKSVAAALEREPGCFLAVRVRAEMEEARNRPDEAARDFKAVLAADPQNPEAHFGLARLARARGDKETAHAEAAAALESARTLPGAWALLGDLSLELGEPAMAVDFWRGAVAQAPRDRAARVSLARLLTAQGDHAGAREQWQAAVELREDAESLAALADAAHASGDSRTEQKALERLTQLKPSPAQWRRVAEVRLGAGDLAGAERAYRRALDAAPRDPESNLGLGKVYLAKGEPQAAVEALRAAGPAGQADLGTLEKRLNLAKITKPEMNALQKAVQALIDKTYRARLAQSPSLSGTIRVRATVDSAGVATLVEVLEDSIHDPDVRACAYWNLRDAIYPTEKPGRYSFTFTFRR
jgi:tetratricopeptide (TPR) repeat protein